jgi:hypothetical protein
MMVGD